MAEGEVQEPQEHSPPMEAAGAVAQVPPQEAEAAYLHSREMRSTAKAAGQARSPKI